MAHVSGHHQRSPTLMVAQVDLCVSSQEEFNQMVEPSMGLPDRPEVWLDVPGQPHLVTIRARSHEQG
eukprot:114690-Prymnesium_polylepis.1